MEDIIGLREYVERVAKRIPSFLDCKKFNDKNIYHSISGIYYLIYECCLNNKLNKDMVDLLKFNVNKLYDDAINYYCNNVNTIFMMCCYISRCIRLIIKRALHTELYWSIVNIDYVCADLQLNCI